MFLKPTLKSHRLDNKETDRFRSAIAEQKSIKITINIDATTLKKLRSLAAKTGVPYQRLLNRTLQEGLAGNDVAEDRLDRTEKEIRLLKRKLAA